MPRRQSTLTVSWSWYLDVPVHPLLTDFSGTITFVFATTLLSASIPFAYVPLYPLVDLHPSYH